MWITGAAQAATTITVCKKNCDSTTIQGAVNGAATGDKVEVKPGFPTNYDERVTVEKQITLEGERGAAPPVLEFTPSGEHNPTLTFTSAAAFSTLKHMTVESKGSEPSTAVKFEQLGGHISEVVATGPVGGIEVHANDVTVGPDVSATSNGAAGEGLFTSFSDGLTLEGVTAVGPNGAVLNEGGTISDSTFHATNGFGLLTDNQAITARRIVATGSTGLRAEGYGDSLISDSLVVGSAGPAMAVQNALNMYNVTAISAGSGDAGIEALHSQASGDPIGEIAAENTVARGGAGGTDIEVEPADHDCIPGPCTAGNVKIGYSNFVTMSPTGVDTTTIGHNQSGDPRFVNGTVGASEDFHLQSDSPLIGAGIEDAQTGTSDLDGGPRPVLAGSPPSIGAYEPPVHTLTVSVSGDGSVSGPGINCSATCSSSYLAGTDVTLTALPGPGEVLSSWGGDCSGTATCQVTMAADHDVAASFVAAPKKSEAPKPSNDFTIGKVVGGKLQVNVTSAGALQLVDLDRSKAKASRLKKKGLLLHPANASGGPGTIELPLRETGQAKAILKRKGKLTAHVQVTFTPLGGTAASKTTALRIKHSR